MYSVHRSTLSIRRYLCILYLFLPNQLNYQLPNRHKRTFVLSNKCEINVSISRFFEFTYVRIRFKNCTVCELNKLYYY